MTQYIIRRSLQSVVLFFLATLISFTIQQLAPGGPLQFFSQDPRVSIEDLERIERLYGLDRSIPVQYVTWMIGEDWYANSSNPARWQSGRCMNNTAKCGRGILRLDFGRSFHFRGESVIGLIVERMPATFLLAFANLFIGLLIGVPMGIISALKRGSWIDHIVRFSTVLFSTVPEWWIGLLLLIIFGGYLRLVPLSGIQTVGDGSFFDRLHHLVLPAFVGAISGWISFSRIIRFEMLEVLNQDYVRTAHAKGLSYYSVIIRHVLRNALMPLVTGMSGIFLLILSGSILFETVFAWPGMGRLTILAINTRDYPVMMALFVISSVLGILGVLMVDILYSIIDPRVRYDLQK